MNKVVFGLTLAASLLSSAAQSEVTLQILDGVLVGDMSADGSVIVGNTVGDYETFRWTEASGVVPLGRASVPVLGRGAGVPEVSADGTRVSATILGADSTYITQGRWTLGLGWEETMPPIPPDGGLLDEAYGSAWGLSENGETLVGLYWRPGQPGGSAHPSRWTQTSGVVDLGTTSGSGRANDANADGTVIVGWEEETTGVWQPTVWVNGARTRLTPTEGFCEAVKVNPAGSIIGGSSWIPGGNLADAALWRWNGSSWVEEILGHLEGTFPHYGYVQCNDLTDDGTVIVGYNRFDFGSSTGFIWTQATGMVAVTEFLIDNGVTIPAGFILTNLLAISASGDIMAGIGQDTTPPFTPRSFIVRMGGTAAVESAAAPIAEPRLRLAANPTRGATAMSLDLPQGGEVRLDLFSVTGRLVRHLVDGPVAAGRRELSWDGRDASGTPAAPGVYFLRFEMGSHRKIHKLVVVR